MGKEKFKNKRGVMTLTNQLGKFERLNQEEMKILINQSVPGLAPVAVIQKRSKIILQVTQTDWTPMTVYTGSPMDAETALAFIWNTLRIAFDCERFGLRVDNLCWDQSRVFVDSQGNLSMVYWPVTTLDQASSSPLTFYYGFYGILYNSGMSPDMVNRYYSYFYQRDYFDFQGFYQMIQELLEQWRRTRYREQRAEDARRREEELKALRPDSRYVVSSGWLEKPDTQEKISLAQAETVFGRDPTVCTVAISGFDGVSRRHAVIRNKEDQYYLSDLDSKNGTFVEGERLKPQERILLTDGMTVRFGNATYIFHKSNLNQTVSIHQMRRQKL